MYHMENTKQKEILKKIRALPLRKYGSAKHKKLIKEYIKCPGHYECKARSSQVVHTRSDHRAWAPQDP